MEKNKTSYGIREWILVFLLALIWGSSFILMKRGLEQFSFSQVAALRLFAAFISLFPFVIFRINEVPLSKWKFIAISAFLGNGIPAILFTIAQTQISSSIAGILNSLTPLFALLVAAIIFKNKIIPMHLAGVIIGFAGAVFILLFRASGSWSGDLSYGALIIVATAMYGFSVNIIKNYLKELSPILISGFALMISGIPYGIYLFSTDFIAKASSGPEAFQSMVYILILGVVGTAVSLILFNRLIKTTSVLFASSVTYLIPVAAVCWGFFDGESLSLMQIFGFIAILFGVYLVNRH